MRSERVSAEDLLRSGPGRVVGAVLLAPLRLARHTLAKGTRLNERLGQDIHEAAASGAMSDPLRLAWPEAGDLHEDEAAERLARAVAGPGLIPGQRRQSRLELLAATDGVLRVKVAALAALNRIDPLEVFTLFHGQAVRSAQVVAGVKVAPHLVAEVAVQAGEQVAREAGPLLAVDPYRPLRVAAIAAEPLAAEALERFEQAARLKVTALGGRFLGVTLVTDPDPDQAAQRLAVTLGRMVADGVALVLVGGVSAGDPLSPLYQSLDSLGGRVERRGVPAHPGSMIWLGTVRATTLLGLPQCGMFSMATAADLVLPRLLTGERVTPDTLADLGHGGLLGPEMRFRFPDYARHLAAPE